MKNRMLIRKMRCCMVLVAATVSFPMGAPAVAATVSWDDGAFFSSLWSAVNNWDPNGSPAGCDVTIGDLVSGMGDATLVDDFFSIDSLTLMNGSSVVNSPDIGVTDFEILVNGATTVESGGRITLYGGDPDALDTDTLDIVDGTVTLDSSKSVGLAVLEVDGAGPSALDIHSNGSLIGNGRIDLEGTPASATRMLRNNGTISAGSIGLVGPIIPATTLQITAVDTNSRIDLDGTAENGEVNINSNATLDLDVELNDDFSGEMNLRVGSTFDTEVGNGMITDTGANINVTTANQFGTAGAAARMVGGSFQMRGGTLTLPTSFDTLVFENDMVGSSGTIENHGELVFEKSGLIFLDFQMVGPNASLTVGENARLTVTDQDFNLDGDGAASNVTTVELGGKLTIGLDDATADDAFNGTINLNGGDLDVTNDADQSWSIGFLVGGELNAGGAATSIVTGDELSVLNDLNVLVDSQLNIATDDVVFGAAADVQIQSGATLDINTNSKWVATGVSVTGAGQLRPGMVQVGVDSSSTDDIVWDVDMVDLDDGGIVDIRDGSTLTVNADTIDPQDGKFSQDMMIGDQAQLTLNLTGGSATFGALSTLTFDGSSATETTFLNSTNDTVVDFQGTLDVIGDGTSAARMALNNATVNVLSSIGYLKLDGGSQLVGDTNTIDGATIGGLGQLRIGSASALRGHGTIDSTLNGLGNSQLVAEGGQLDLNGAIVRVGTIGTDGGSAVLNVTLPWNTSVANSVRMDEGTLQGAAITNDGASGISGRGTILAEVINTTRIDAGLGGTLVVDNAANDWDGAAGNGTLNAINGNLELRDNVGFAFGGAVRALPGREVFANGFALQFLPAASLELSGGTFRSTAGTDFPGSLESDTGPTRIEVDGEFRFVSGATAALDSTLRLASNETIVESGVTFSGAAALRNVAGSKLRLLDGANIGVEIQNDGNLALGMSPGQASGLDFRQTINGTLEIELMGTAGADFDRLNLTGLAELDGSLDVSLLSGFAPALGDSFAFLSAAGGVSGTFSTLNLPSLASGLGWNVNYDSTLVNLLVVAATGNPDFDGNGALDCVDADALVAEIVAGTNGPTYDLTGDGDVTRDDLTQWLAEAGAANLPSGDSYLLGDADLNGIVDGADFDLWSANKFSSTAAFCSGDFNADGSVDGHDFLLWNAGKFKSAARAAAVPESAGRWMLLLGLMATLGSRRVR